MMRFFPSLQVLFLNQHAKFLSSHFIFQKGDSRIFLWKTWPIPQDRPIDTEIFDAINQKKITDYWIILESSFLSPQNLFP